jgi:acyl-CoA synthetase (AMP-forming)/AMP-acid ligase II
MRRFDLNSYVSNVAKYAITETSMAPPMVHAIIKSSLPVRELFTSLRYVSVSGAPIDVATLRLLKDQLHPDATLAQGWGMTEIGMSTFFRYGEHDDSGSCGRPAFGFEMRIVDSDGSEVRSNTASGELQVRTPGLMMGYRHTKPSDKDSQWFPTGDIARISDGKLYIVGRVKELIKVKGLVPPWFSSCSFSRSPRC